MQTRTVDPGITVVELSGRLNLGNTLQSIENAIHKMIEEGARKLVIDLAAVTFIDSAGMGTLIGCNGRIEQAGGRMRIAGAKGTTAQSFAVAHVERIIPFDPDAESACRSF